MLVRYWASVIRRCKDVLPSESTKTIGQSERLKTGFEASTRQSERQSCPKRHRSIQTLDPLKPNSGVALERRFGSSPRRPVRPAGLKSSFTATKTLLDSTTYSQIRINLSARPRLVRCNTRRATKCNAGRHLPSLGFAPVNSRRSLDRKILRSPNLGALVNQSVRCSDLEGFDQSSKLVTCFSCPSF